MIMLFGDEYQCLVANRTYRVDNNNNDAVLSNGNIDNTEESTSMIRRKLILMIYWQSYTVSAIVHLIRSASSYNVYPPAEFVTVRCSKRWPPSEQVRLLPIQHYINPQQNHHGKELESCKRGIIPPSNHYHQKEH